MPRMIQLRHVPDNLHRTLKARAALAGMSLSDYLVSEIRRIADRPTLSAMRKDTMVVWNAFVAIFNGGRFEADPVRGVVVRVEPDPA